MISFLKTWANQIIVAVIIATIFEMLLPNGNNKKYIKMIIGLYVLFTIIQPIITKVTGNSLDISDFNYRKYFDKDVIETTSQDFENNNSNLIKQAYIDNITNDIKVKMKQKGYEVNSCSIDIMEDEKQDTYGTIENIILSINKINNEDEEEIKSNTIKVENINIGNGITNSNITNSTIEKNNMSDKEKIKIIEYLADEYSVFKENIIIN